jgi:hypothetical protein
MPVSTFTNLNLLNINITDRFLHQKHAIHERIAQGYIKSSELYLFAILKLRLQKLLHFHTLRRRCGNPIIIHHGLAVIHPQTLPYDILAS